MLTTSQDIVLVILIVIGSLLCMMLMNRYWPSQKRWAHNNLIGYQFSILGTTYAVIIGFMLYTVWTNFGAADLNADSEANALVNVYRLADGLPDQQQRELKEAARSYANAVIADDWPAMSTGSRGSLETHYLNKRMWTILMSVHSASPEQITAEDHALYELSAMAEHRRIRQLQSISRLPGVLWWVLIAGAALTIVSACLFGTTSGWLHSYQILAISLLIGLVLVAIADIDRPFQGSVHINDAAFRVAQRNMADR